MCLCQKYVVAFYILLADILLYNDNGDAKSVGETGFWHDTKVRPSESTPRAGFDCYGGMVGMIHKSATFGPNQLNIDESSPSKAFELEC